MSTQRLTKEYVSEALTRDLRRLDKKLQIMAELADCHMDSNPGYCHMDSNPGYVASRSADTSDNQFIIMKLQPFSRGYE